MNPLSKAAVHNTNTLSHDEDTLEATRLMYLKQIELRQHEIAQRRDLLSLQSKMDLQNQILDQLDTQIHEKTEHDYGSDSHSEGTNEPMKLMPPTFSENPSVKTNFDQSKPHDVTTKADIPQETGPLALEAALSAQALRSPMQSQSVSPLTTSPVIASTPSRDDPQDDDILAAPKAASPEVSQESQVDFPLVTQETRSGPSIRVLIVGLTNNKNSQKPLLIEVLIVS